MSEATRMPLLRLYACFRFPRARAAVTAAFVGRLSSVLSALGEVRFDGPAVVCLRVAVIENQRRYGDGR
jgi:hypothetical protein